MHEFQALINGMSAEWQRERATTQLTLGKLIEALRAMPPSASVANLTHAHSYRGYYCDFALELGNGTRPAGELLSDCQAAMGQVFQGYKGGDYMMGTLTPVWIASYGDTGKKLMALRPDGTIETADDD